MSNSLISTMTDQIEFEVINMVPKEIPVTEENGTVTVDLTGYDPPAECPDFSAIPGLQDLKLFSNYLKEIPDGFCNMEQLKRLYMSCSPIKPDNGLLRLPAEFDKLSNLEELHLVGNHFEAFPLPICQLINIRKLYMDNCTLIKIPKEIKNMLSLVVVDFSYNSLGKPDSLPKEIFDLPNLKDLYLIDCQLNELPPEIGNLKSLEGLRIGKNNLSKLPDELYDLNNLRKLNAERNNISELSPRIGQLRSLTLLLMMENRLTTLPDEVKDLENCKHINLFDNKLTCLPQSIINMPVLESLVVDGNNNLRSPPLDVCTRGIDSIKGYFESLAAVDTRAVHSQRLKVVLLGEAGAGKSSLAYALVNAKALAYPDGQPQSTVGVDFYTWRPKLDGVEFHIVDCAGQRRYQLTHPFFLSSEALHILVVDLFNYKPSESCFSETVGDWLDLVISRILKPRIMIVPTHLDKFDPSDASSVRNRCEDILDRIQHYCKRQKALIDREISEKKKKALKNPVQGGKDPEWKKNNPPIISSVLQCPSANGAASLTPDNESYIAMVPVSNISELTGIIALQEEIMRAAKDSQLFPSVGRDLPEDWIKLEKALKKHREEDQVQCMSYEDLETFAKHYTDLSSRSLSSAVTYLDSIGELRFYSNIPSRYKVFIDLRWLAKLVKCLFCHDLKTTLKYDESFLTYDVLDGDFEELKAKLLKEAVLTQALLRCLWDELNLDDDMFPQMVELLHHLGLACQMSQQDGSDEVNLLVPWFLSEYPDGVEALSGSLPEDQEEINLLFMMGYLPPGLFDRLRVRCCSLNCEYYNWKDHVLLFVDEHRVVIRKHKYPPCAEPSSPAIYIKGRGPKKFLESLWELLLRLVQETDALLIEWQRLSVHRYSLCPPCAQKGKPKPCLFPCNWMSSSSLKMQHGSHTKICNGNVLLKGDKFHASLIYPPADVVKRLLDTPSATEPVAEDVPDSLIGDLSQKMSKQWKLVAGYLGVSNDYTDALDQENSSSADKIIAMLNAWKHKKAKSAKRSCLMNALVRAKRNDLAEMVRTYKERTPSISSAAGTIEKPFVFPEHLESKVKPSSDMSNSSNQNTLEGGEAEEGVELCYSLETDTKYDVVKWQSQVGNKGLKVDSGVKLASGNVCVGPVKVGAGIGLTAALRVDCIDVADAVLAGGGDYALAHIGRILAHVGDALAHVGGTLAHAGPLGVAEQDPAARAKIQVGNKGLKIYSGVELAAENEDLDVGVAVVAGGDISGDLPASIQEDSPLTDTNILSSIVTRLGGVVAEGSVKLICPPGAVDNPVTVNIRLEDPSKYYGLIVQKDLENDVMFIAPIINLQPNGHSFKKPIKLTTPFRFNYFNSVDVLILHGTEARDGKITWQDITRNSQIDATSQEVTIELEHFSIIMVLLRWTLIRTKDIVCRLNLLAFNYTLLVLLNKSRPSSAHDELALLFVSQDVYHEQFYREDETSALMQLKNEGFVELHVRSIGGQKKKQLLEKRIYNNEKLQVTIHLGEDYNLVDSRHGSMIFNVHSSVWWNTGHVIRFPLEWVNVVRSLCGKITVQGEYGHTSERNFSEQDLCGYVRSILGVKDAIFNLVPITQLLKMPQELVNLVTKSLMAEDEQLDIFLQRWSKSVEVEDLAALRQDLKGLNQKDYRVTERGQMHIRHLREFATKISSSKYIYADSIRYFCCKVKTLCKSVFKDCCIELEGSAEGVERAASSSNHVNYLINHFIEHHRPIPEDIARKYKGVCSSSGESSTKTFLAIAPHLIQNIKEIFVDYERIVPQNGLRGLSEENVNHLSSSVRNAQRNNRVRELVHEECEILEKLCLKNHDKQATAEVKEWGERLEISQMLRYLKLKQFFQHCRQDIRLYKRLDLFSRRLKNILTDREDVDEVFMHDFSNVLLCLVHFAKFDPSKLVRFELVDSTNTPLTCSRENVKYDKHENTYSQRFHIRKESEDKIQLHAVACVSIDGRICKKGAFQSVIMLNASAKQAFDRCAIRFVDIAVMNVEDKDSGSLRVVLCATQKEKLLEIIRAFKRELSEDVVDFSQSEVTQCHLTMRTLDSTAGTVLSLRLVYKWRSEAVALDSKDFVTFADSSAGGACLPEVQFVGLDDPLMAEDAAAFSLSSADGKFALGTFDQLRKNERIQCEKIEYHLHQTVNQMTGHVVVAGDKATVNEQMPTQRALQEGPSSAPKRCITEGK